MRVFAVVGPGQSGKDYAREWLVENAGFRAPCCTSRFAAPVVWSHWHMDNGLRHVALPTEGAIEEFWSRRREHREYWAAVMWAYNWSNGSGCRLYRDMVDARHDLLVGIRRRDELKACVVEGIVTDIIAIRGGEPDPTYELGDLASLNVPVWRVDNQAKNPEAFDTRMRQLIEAIFSP